MGLPGQPGDYQFTLNPKIQLNEQMGNAPEPDTKHYWNKDLYTHIKWGRVSDPEADEDGWMDGRKHDMMRKDSLLIGKSVLSLDSISAVTMAQKPEFGMLDKDLGVAAHFRLSGNGPDTNFTALYIVRDSLLIPDMVTLKDRGVKIRIDGFRPAEATFEAVVWENLSIRRDFIVMQATIFPQINLLWLGCIIMTAGALMSVRQTRRKRRNTPTPKSRMIHCAHVIGMGRLGRHLAQRLEDIGVQVQRWNRTSGAEAQGLGPLGPYRKSRSGVLGRIRRRHIHCGLSNQAPIKPENTADSPCRFCAKRGP